MFFRNSCSESVVMSGLRSSAVLAARVRFVGRALDVQARRSGWVDFLDQLDFSPLEEAVQLLDVGFVEAELGRGGRDLGVREHADPLAACDQTLDLFKLLKFRY